MFLDRKVSAGCVVAWGLWSTTALLLGVSLLVPHEAGLAVGRFGLACSVAAAVAHIRTFFVAQSKHLKNAFELGQDAARADIVRIPTPR